MCEHHHAAKHILCSQCDMLVALPHLEHGQKAACPRCGTTLTVMWDAPRQRPTAYALVALFMLLLSNLFPFVNMNVAGVSSEVTLMQIPGVLFSENYDGLSPDEMLPILRDKIRGAQIRRMVVTMGAQGAVFATLDGEDGYCPAKKVDVKDTTGAGDAFFAGAVIGQTYGKTMMESCEIGTRLAASVITTGENVCPRYLPSEFGLDVSKVDDAQIALEF